MTGPAAPPPHSPPPGMPPHAPPTGQPPYGQPGAYGMAPQPKMSVMAIVSLVLGIGSLCVTWIPFVGIFGVVTAIAGAVLGFLGMKQINEQPQTYTGKGVAIAGIVTSIIAFLIGLVWVVFIGMLGAMGSAASEF